MNFYNGYKMDLHSTFVITVHIDPIYNEISYIIRFKSNNIVTYSPIALLYYNVSGLETNMNLYMNFDYE